MSSKKKMAYYIHPIMSNMQIHIIHQINYYVSKKFPAFKWEEKGTKMFPPKKLFLFFFSSFTLAFDVYTHTYIRHSLFVLHPSNSFKCLAFIKWYESLLAKVNSDDNRKVWQKCHFIVLALHVFIVICMRWTVDWIYQRKEKEWKKRP